MEKKVGQLELKTIHFLKDQNHANETLRFAFQ